MISALKNFAPFLLYLAFIIAFMFSLIGQVRFGLFYLIPLLPLQNVVDKLQAFPLGKDLNDILLFAMIFGWFISKAIRNESPLAKTSFNLLLFLYLIFTYVNLCMGSSFLHEPFPINPLDERLQNWKNYMVLPLLFFLTLNNMYDVKDFKKIILLMCLSMFLMNYYNVQQVKDMTSWTSRVKVHGTFSYLGANEVAAFYATYTFVLLGLFFYIKEKAARIGMGFLIWTNVFLIVFLFSRGAYAATLIAATIFALIRKKILIVPIILLIISWQTLLPKEVIQRMTFSEHEGQLDDSASTRLVLWQQSMAYFKQNPVMGIGFNVFQRIGLERDSHNVFVRTLAEQGIIGVTFLLSIFLIAIRRSWRLFTKADDPWLKGLGLGFMCCVISNMVGNFFGDRWTALPLAAYFWIFLGMVERGNLLVDRVLAPQPKAKVDPRTLRHRYGTPD
jgi:O-antigen ligase